jgi:hypothetical protein
MILAVTTFINALRIALPLDLIECSLRTCFSWQDPSGFEFYPLLPTILNFILMIIQNQALSDVAFEFLEIIVWFGIVWHLHCLAFAWFGICIVWYLHCLAFAWFGICMVWHLHHFTFLVYILNVVAFPSSEILTERDTHCEFLKGGGCRITF